MAPAGAQCSPRAPTERRVIIEKYYQRLTQDFDTNKRICEEVAIIQSKRLRNKIAGFTTVSSREGEDDGGAGPIGALQPPAEERRRRPRRWCRRVAAPPTLVVWLPS